MFSLVYLKYGSLRGVIFPVAAKYRSAQQNILTSSLFATFILPSKSAVHLAGQLWHPD